MERLEMRRNETKKEHRKEQKSTGNITIRNKVEKKEIRDEDLTEQRKNRKSVSNRLDYLLDYCHTVQCCIK